MQQKTITLNKFGIREMLLNCDKGEEGVGKNMFFLYRNETDNCLTGQWLHGTKETNDPLKTIVMSWFDFDIALNASKHLSDPLELLPAYFDAEGKCKHKYIETEVPPHQTTSKGAASYDQFFDLKMYDRSGVILHVIALQKRLQEIFGNEVDVLRFVVKMATLDGKPFPVVMVEFRQPVLLNYSLDGQKLTLDITDGIAPFVIHIDGEPLEGTVFELEPGEHTVLVTDAKGSTRELAVTIPEPEIVE